MTILAASPDSESKRSRLGDPVEGLDPCPVCGESAALLVAIKDRQGGPLQTLACRSCSLTRSDPLPQRELIEAFHGSQYRSSYKGVQTPRAKHVYRAAKLAVQRARRLDSHLNAPSRLLDVGCSSGELLYLLRRRGHRAMGIEVDRGYAEFARHEYGVEIDCQSVMSATLPEAAFDGVALNHVLEHLPDPCGALRRIASWCKETGLLFLEVPNIYSRNQHPAKRFHIAHAIGFSPKSLSRALRRAGWCPIEISLDAWDRNIFAVARKADSPCPDAAGESEPELLTLPSAGATLRYYARPSTYVRWSERVAGFGREFWAIRQGLSPKQLLDSLSEGGEIGAHVKLKAEPWEVV